MLDLRHRFPGITEGNYQRWARFDGPAGTQVVDVAIEATRAWQQSGNNANSHGVFPAAHACDELVERCQSAIGRLLHADPSGVILGPSTTANVFSITRAIGRDLAPGDEIVCTKLDHDSNVAPWLEVAADVGAVVRLAEFDVASGRLPTSNVTELFNERTRWVAMTGASNAIGTMPDVAAVTAAAHAAGALVMIDGVHLTPHAPVDLAAIGCDVYSTSAYKWYGPHIGISWVEPGLLDRLHAYKVRPAPDHGPAKLMLGTPAYESIAAVEAAVEFLLSVGVDTIQAHERALLAPLLDALLGDERITFYGPRSLDDRAPTVAFNVAGHSAAEVAALLARQQLAVWDGNYYAPEAFASFGVDAAVRVGMALYITRDDVDRLIDAIGQI